MRRLIQYTLLFISAFSLLNKTNASDTDESDIQSRLKKVASLPLPAEKLTELSNTVDFKGKTYTLKSSITVNLPKTGKKRTKMIAKLNKKKKIPIRIIATVKYTPKNNTGKKPKYNFKGSAELYLINEKNSVTLKKKVKLNKLCPT